MSGGRGRVARRIAVTSAIVGLLVIGGCGGDDTDGDATGSDVAREARSSNGATVDIVDSRYRPATVRIKAGGTVTWINRDPEDPNTAEHHSKRGEFDTHVLFPYEKKTLTLRKPGRFRYHSSLDPVLSGLVIVEPAGG